MGAHIHINHQSSQVPCTFQQKDLRFLPSTCLSAETKKKLQHFFFGKSWWDSADANWQFLCQILILGVLALGPYTVLVFTQNGLEDNMGRIGAISNPKPR